MRAAWSCGSKAWWVDLWVRVGHCLSLSEEKPFNDQTSLIFFDEQAKCSNVLGARINLSDIARVKDACGGLFLALL